MASLLQLLILCALVPRLHAVTLNIAWFCMKDWMFRPTFSADNTIGSIQYAMNAILADPTLLPEIDAFE